MYPNRLIQPIVAIVMLLATLPAWANPPLNRAVSTGFEGIRQTAFSVTDGTSSAIFSGGNSNSIGNFSLYRMGGFAWMVNGSNTGEIRFDNDGAIAVEFYARPASGGDLVITALDNLDQTIDSKILSSSLFQAVEFSGSIRRITVENQAGGIAAIDDFGFDPVIPEPATGVLLGLASLVGLWSRPCPTATLTLALTRDSNMESHSLFCKPEKVVMESHSSIVHGDDRVFSSIDY